MKTLSDPQPRDKQWKNAIAKIESSRYEEEEFLSGRAVCDKKDC